MLYLYLLLKCVIVKIRVYSERFFTLNFQVKRRRHYQITPKMNPYYHQITEAVKGLETGLTKSGRIHEALAHLVDRLWWGFMKWTDKAQHTIFEYLKMSEMFLLPAWLVLF